MTSSRMQKCQHDQHNKDRSFRPSQAVYIGNFRPDPVSLPATIESQQGPLSFHCRLQTGQLVRRHQDHIRDRRIGEYSERTLPTMGPVQREEERETPKKGAVQQHNREAEQIVIGEGTEPDGNIANEAEPSEIEDSAVNHAGAAFQHRGGQ